MSKHRAHPVIDSMQDYLHPMARAFGWFTDPPLPWWSTLRIKSRLNRGLRTLSQPGVKSANDFRPYFLRFGHRHSGCAFWGLVQVQYVSFRYRFVFGMFANSVPSAVANAWPWYQSDMSEMYAHGQPWFLHIVCRTVINAHTFCQFLGTWTLNIEVVLLFSSFPVFQDSRRWTFLACS